MLSDAQQLLAEPVEDEPAEKKSSIAAQQQNSWSPQRPYKSTINDEVKLAEQQRLQQIQRFTEAKEQAKQYMAMNRQQAKNKFYIQSGNNSSIVKDCMLLRDD